MGSKIVVLVCLGVLVGLGRSDFDQDKAECAEKLTGLATCLSFVQGQAKSPTSDCCGGAKQVVEKSAKCLCVLIKDRNDPKLGLKLNITRALQLPSLCHVAFNVTTCVELLHLAPNTTEAKEFEGFEKSLTNEKNSTSTTPTASISGNSTSVLKNDGDRGKRWRGLEMVLGTLPWFLTTHVVLYV